MTLDTQNSKALEVKPVPETRRIRFANQLDAFIVNNQHLAQSPDNYKRYSLTKAREISDFLKAGAEVNSVTDGSVETLVIPKNGMVSFVDMTDNTFAGSTTIKYEPWELDVPSVHGTCTNDGYEGRGMNSKRIQIAAQYFQLAHGQQLHSARRFDNVASRKTWEKLAHEGRAEWVPHQGRFKYIP